MLFYGCCISTVQTKKLGHQAISPSLLLQCSKSGGFFFLFVGKMRHFPTLIMGDGKYMIQLKCPKYFLVGIVHVHVDYNVKPKNCPLWNQRVHGLKDFTGISLRKLKLIGC